MRISIIGGGVVGLNIAYSLCESPVAKNSEIYLFETEPFLGHHTSTRNSEVIHAGFAYPPGTLKAQLCIEGNRKTYELLNKLGVPCKRCGKWIIAQNDEELSALENITANAKACGAAEMNFSSTKDALKAEPALYNICGALFSPQSGILDAAEYIKALEISLANKENISLIYPCKVTGISSSQIETTRGTMEFDIVINAAGLFADEIYKLSGGKRSFQIVPFKGEYYTWKKGYVNGLIYPVPRKFLTKDKDDPTKTGNFGIHLHRSINGDTLVGPSLIKIGTAKKTDYSIETPAEVFAEFVSPFIRDIRANDLTPFQAGNRPKLFEDGKPVADFQIFREENIIHLLGIESPGLTAAPAIAGYVVGMVKG